MKTVIAVLLTAYTLYLWLGHRAFIKSKIPFQYATGYQLIILTMTSLSLWIGATLWIVIIVAILWVMCPFLVGYALANKSSMWSPFTPTNMLTIFGWFLAANISANHALPSWAWVAAGLGSLLVVEILFRFVFPDVRNEKTQDRNSNVN